jgi:hypothetical protein
MVDDRLSPIARQSGVSVLGITGFPDSVLADTVSDASDGGRSGFASVGRFRPLPG